MIVVPVRKYHKDWQRTGGEDFACFETFELQIAPLRGLANDSGRTISKKRLKELHDHILIMTRNGLLNESVRDCVLVAGQQWNGLKNNDLSESMHLFLSCEDAAWGSYLFK